MSQMDSIPKVQQLNWFMHVILSMLHKPYIWGGDDPLGFDCSGSVIYGLQSVGLWPLDQDTTAEGLWQKFKTKKTDEVEEGCLLFWFNKEGKAIHVAVALDEYFCMTADGGGSHILTMEDAIKHNAFTKIRRIDHRFSHPKAVNIFQ